MAVELSGVLGYLRGDRLGNAGLVPPPGLDLGDFRKRICLPIRKSSYDSSIVTFGVNSVRLALSNSG